jgi:hypothetical protein
MVDQRGVVAFHRFWSGSLSECSIGARTLPNDWTQTKFRVQSHPSWKRAAFATSKKCGDSSQAAAFPSKATSSIEVTVGILSASDSFAPCV